MMGKKKMVVPQYGTVERKGALYYRTRIQDADGKQVSLYATTCEELYEKQLEARHQIEELLFRRKHPTVAEYCEKWLLMQSAKVSSGLYNTVNMLIKCIFYSAERSQLIDYNPCVGLSAKGGKVTKKKDALTDQQAAVLLDTVKGLPP